LLLDLDQALLAECVAAVEIPGDPVIGIKVFVARGTVHVANIMSILNFMFINIKIR